TLQWLRRGKSLDEPWQVFPIAEEPTLHRIRFADLYGDGKPRLVVTPLMGRGPTKAKNWMDGRPARVLAFSIPKDPAKDRWGEGLLDESLHVIHTLDVAPALRRRKGPDLLTASYEGVTLFQTDGRGWHKTQIGEGNQEKPNDSRGSSEVKHGKLKDGTRLIA